MNKSYYKLPLDFEKFFENGGQFEKCTELESIDQHIELLLTTCPGEHRFDADYGCRIWELDFERIISQEQWKNLFTEYVTQSINNYEKRISDIVVSIDIKDAVREEIRDNTMIRKRVDIAVSATINSSDQRCSFGYKLFLGPLSNE